ncbi:MAG TPA: hypothetical protein VMS56_05250 [Thermoanaerobaculia bacterium]|nr:hypothetical protein [Thermoanaerobaculia bacterium]
MMCDQDRIYDLVENPAIEDAALEQHMQMCPSCMELYGSVQEFAMSLADPEVWAADEPEMPACEQGSPKLDRLVAESIRVEDEKAVGEWVLSELIPLPVAEWHGRLRQLEGVCTLGLVHALLTDGRSRSHRAPREFEDIANLAIEVADALDHQAYPPGMVEQARGQGWKDRANALRLRGEVQDALWSLDEAERHFRLQPISEFDLATVDYVRATILNETDRLQEGLGLARRCADVFLDFGDEQRFRHSRMIEASLLYDLGSRREARETFMALLKPTQQAEDLTSLPMLFLNIAHCSVDLNDPDTASIYFLQAARLSEELGQTEQVIAARWGLGRLLVSTGRYAEGVDRLKAASRELERFGREGDAALVDLDIVEAFVLLGRYDEIPAICRRLVERFSRMGGQRRALTALSYLREALDAQVASPELVKNVRKYVEELPRQPEMLFLPPPY